MESCRVVFILLFLLQETSTDCIPGRYGQQCQSECSRTCLRGQVCDGNTGACEGGCMPGWTGFNCSDACPIGTYGVNCQEHCSSHCVRVSTCYPGNGECQGGCLTGWHGLQCENADSDADLSSLDLGLILCLSVAVILTLALSAIVFRLNRKLKEQRTSNYEPSRTSDKPRENTAISDQYESINMEIEPPPYPVFNPQGDTNQAFEDGDCGATRIVIHHRRPPPATPYQGDKEEEVLKTLPNTYHRPSPPKPTRVDSEETVLQESKVGANKAEHESTMRREIVDDRNGNNPKNMTNNHLPTCDETAQPHHRENVGDEDAFEKKKVRYSPILAAISNEISRKPQVKDSKRRNAKDKSGVPKKTFQAKTDDASKENISSSALRPFDDEDMYENCVPEEDKPPVPPRAAPKDKTLGQQLQTNSTPPEKESVYESVELPGTHETDHAC